MNNLTSRDLAYIIGALFIGWIIIMLDFDIKFPKKK